MNNHQLNVYRNINRSVHEQIAVANVLYHDVRNNNSDHSSLKRLRDEAEDGNPWATLWLGECYLKGITNNRDNNIEKGIKCLESLEDFPLAQFKLAQWYLEEEDHQDQKKGKKLLKRAAEGDLVDAHYLLGKHYISGEVFKQNDTKAKHHLKKAHDLGHLKAHKELMRFTNG